MSAVEATTPQTGPGRLAGAVIRMSDHPAARNRRNPPRPSPAPAPAGDSLEQQIALHMEALFHAHGMTLTDDDTVDVYVIALDAVAMMLKGAHADGSLADGPHATLQAMLAGMRNAPQLL